MKFCSAHWAQLRTAIDARGLGALVADNGEKAASNLLSEVNAGTTIDNFDPLMSAHNAIMANALDAAGGRAYDLLTGADECPLCYCNREDPANAVTRVNDYDRWIDRAADGALTAWTELGNR